MGTIEGNKKIAEFMGGEIMPNGTFRNYTKMQIPDWAFRQYDFDALKVGAFKYHSSWDWLMPVLEKICKIQLKYLNVDEEYKPYPRTFGMMDEEGNFMVRLNCAQVFSASTLIEATWLAVTDFIQWHTSSTTPK